MTFFSFMKVSVALKTIPLSFSNSYTFISIQNQLLYHTLLPPSLFSPDCTIVSVVNEQVGEENHRHNNQNTLTKLSFFFQKKTQKQKRSQPFFLT